MIFFDKTRTIGQDANGKNVVWVSVYVDTAANLPAYNDYQSDGFILCMASEGRCIDTGDLYRLDSAGTWQISQAGTGTYTKAEIDTLLNAKQDVLTFDSTPTQDSANPVTSDGIWTDQQRQEAEIGVVANAGAKNLAPIETRTNKAGNKWIVGADSGNTEPINLIAGDYIFTAVSSSTGSGQCQIKLAYSDGTTELTTVFNFGSTMTLTFTASKDVVGYGVYSNAAPVTFEKMMIRPAAITDPTFQPYAPTNRELYEMILALQ